MIRTAGDLIAEAQAVISCVDIDQAREILSESPIAVILDVREADSVAESKLSESIHISRGLLEMKAPKLLADSQMPILTHCAGGGRASLAALTLQNMGYKNVHAITAKYEDLKKALG